jgi:hypothetical protein
MAVYPRIPPMTRRCLIRRNLNRGTDRTRKPLSVPRPIFSPCPPNVAHSASLRHPYAQSSTACLWKNPIPLSTQSVAACSLTTCQNMNALNATGKVLDPNSSRSNPNDKELTSIMRKIMQSNDYSSKR